MTSWQQYVLLHKHIISVHLNSSLKKPRSLLSNCFCFTQHVWGNEYAAASAVKLSIQSSDRNLSPSVIISGLMQSSSPFSARARYSVSVSISNPLSLFCITEFCKQIAVQLQCSQFCVLKIEEPDNVWIFVFNLCFGELNLINMNWSLDLVVWTAY